MNKDPYKVSRFMYILEAAFDYYLSVMVTGAYLARLTTQIGISDALTGIIASLGAFASCFQVLAIFLFSNRRVKKPLSMLYPVARLGSLMLYAVPFLPASVRTKTVLFMGLLFIGQLLTNAINAPKINWFMSLVDDKKRGNFTASKEIVTLLGYMVFSLVMGNAVDRLTEAGREEESFLLCAAVVFTLTTLHTLTLLISREKPPKEKDALPLGRLLRELVRDTRVLKVVLVSVLWTVATHVTMPFESTYRIKELGFSMTFISAVTMASSFVRILVSKPLGRYADRHSFTAMLNFCFVAALASFLVGALMVPENGAPMYILNAALYAVGMAGVNSGNINLIYEHVTPEQRVCALAFKNAVVGLTGFLTTIVTGYLVDAIQKNGNRFLGIPAYAQQVTSAISVVILGVLLVYLNTTVRAIKRPVAAGED